MQFLRNIWIGLSFLWAFLPKAWPVIKFIGSWAIDFFGSRKQPELPAKPEQKEVESGASAQILQAIEPAAHKEETTVPQLVPEIDKKKSLIPTGAATFFKSNLILKNLEALDEEVPEGKVFGFTSQGSVILDPTVDPAALKNITSFRGGSRVGSKFLT